MPLSEGFQRSKPFMDGTTEPPGAPVAAMARRCVRDRTGTMQSFLRRTARQNAKRATMPSAAVATLGAVTLACTGAIFPGGRNRMNPTPRK